MTHPPQSLTYLGLHICSCDSQQLKEERIAKHQHKQAAAQGSEERIARLKAQAEEENRHKIMQAESDRTQKLEAAEREITDRFEHLQVKQSLVTGSSIAKNSLECCHDRAKEF